MVAWPQGGSVEGSEKWAGIILEVGTGSLDVVCESCREQKFEYIDRNCQHFSAQL